VPQIPLSSVRNRTSPGSLRRERCPSFATSASPVADLFSAARQPRLGLRGLEHVGSK